MHVINVRELNKKIIKRYMYGVSLCDVYRGVEQATTMNLWYTYRLSQ